MNAADITESVKTTAGALTSDAITDQEIRHGRLTEEVAAECIVLLENDGCLPFAPGKVALFGVGARHTVKGGTGSGDVNSRNNVNIEQGLMHAGFEIGTATWLDRYDKAYEKAYEEYQHVLVPAKAREMGVEPLIVTFMDPFKGIGPVPILQSDIDGSDSDKAVYVVSRLSGEGADRRDEPGDYRFSQIELDQIRQLADAYGEFVLLLNIGGLMDLSPLKEIEGIGAIVLMGQLGERGGDAMASVISGKTNPSGKLVDTWTRNYSDHPSSATFSSNDGNTDDEYYSEGVFVGYRYFDSFGVEPLYPFGFGKTYTEFEITLENAAQEDDRIEIECAVKNTGAANGREVVQVYATQPWITTEITDEAPIADPYQKLVAFQKTKDLSPGESERMRLKFDISELASYSEKESSWMLAEGDFIIRIGTHSRNTVCAAVARNKSCKPVRILKSLFPHEEAVNEITPDAESADEYAEPVWEGPSDGGSINYGNSFPSNAPIMLELNTEKVCTETASYAANSWPETSSPEIHGAITLSDVDSGRATLAELVNQLTIDEMATLCVGTARSDDGSITGMASTKVPGAAGDTSSVLRESRGIRGLVLADGPAGLRLQPVYKTDLEGNRLPGGDLLGDTLIPFDPKYDDSNSIDHYQYCTAIPIGWSLAQSWDPDRVSELGRMVGEEMEKFDVDIWLAPALNIHRNPLCGRNFEYYSEDPLISGSMAAAMVKGVQSHTGKGCCIKHLVANNQEDNRYFSNDWITERTMREIYCKGFEIAIRESSPYTIMTSYNLVNGIHTANDYDLIQSFSRDECGFDGFVMTDWYSSQYFPEFTGKSDKYPIASSVGCIYAGCDNQQPGCKENVDDIVSALIVSDAADSADTQEFSINEGNLRNCAFNIINVVMRCSKSQ